MALAPRTPDVVLTADWPVVQKAMRAIMRGVTTANGSLADERLERITGQLAGSSARFADAAYLAVQILRDLDRIDESEAVYLLDAICDARMERFEDNDAEYQAMLLAGGPLEEHISGMMQRRHALEAQYHLARGETALARMIVEDYEAFGQLRAEGEIVLLDDKPMPAVLEPPDPARVAALTEAIVRLAATENSHEAYKSHVALFEEKRDGHVMSAIAAVQQAREIGVLSREESVSLLDDMVGEVVLDAMEADRETARITRRMLAITQELTYEIAMNDPHYIELDRRRSLKADRLTVMYYRRFGEHWIANLLKDDPIAYDEMRQAPVGDWRTPAV
ncbi:MAG TPA: hypothetical protein VH277_16190 [Gemmatimonadaceae bacterium]|jgi:hypothetical protein|nr:hypothetical protein [Gemmatimonadaceae bacterium]